MSRTIVIVGGVAGGATAATRLRRLSGQDRIIILYECFTDQVQGRKPIVTAYNFS